MSALRLCSTVILGLLAGALSFEGLVLVPYWRSLGCDAFAKLQAGFGPRLYRFFAPLTVVATLLPVVCAIDVVLSTPKAASDWFTLISSVLAVSLVAIYRLYFHSANQRLPMLAGQGADAALSVELSRWHRIHMARTILCIAAFVLAALGVAS